MNAPRTEASFETPPLNESTRAALDCRRDEILAHPLLEDVRRALNETHMRISLPERYPGKMKDDNRRMLLIGLILNLEAVADDEDPSNWPTPARLKAAMIRFGMEGARRIDDFVARLAQTGYIRLDAHPLDRRAKWVRSEEPLRAWFLEWLKPYLEGLDLLFPDRGRVSASERCPGFLRAYLRSSWRNSSSWNWTLQGNPRFATFLQSDLSMKILSAVPLLGRTGGGGVREADILDVVRPLGVSRSHLRHVLAHALELSYVTRSGPRGQYWGLTAQGRAEELRFLAHSLAATELTYRSAIEDVTKAGADCRRPQAVRPLDGPGAP